MWRILLGFVALAVVFSACAKATFPALPKYKTVGTTKVLELKERAAASPLHSLFTGVKEYDLKIYSITAETSESVYRFYDSAMAAAGWTRLDGGGYLAGQSAVYYMRFQKGSDFVEIVITGTGRYSEWVIVIYH